MRRLLFALLAVVLFAVPARAAPMASPFSMVRTQSTVIVVGTVRQNAQGDLTIDVDKVVRGLAQRPTAPLSVKQSPDGHVTISNERVVAFIDGQNALRWVGRLVAGPSIETGVIKLQGFFDFNAHLVTPAIMSLAQLGSALQTGSLVQTFDATLAFPDGHGGFRPSPTKRFTLQYDTNGAQILSLQGLALPCLGNPSLFGLSWGSFEVRLSDTCLTNNSAPQRDRSLDLDGELTGVAANGDIEVRVVPSRPFMNEVEYDTFARDRDLVQMTNVVRVALANGTAWSWRVESALVDPSGHSHAAQGMSSTMSGDVYEFTDAKITLSPSPSLGSPGGNPRGIVTLVESGKITRCVLTQHGTDTPCTLSHVAPIWVRR